MAPMRYKDPLRIDRRYGFRSELDGIVDALNRSIELQAESLS